MTLSSTQKTILNHASRQAICSCMSRVQHHWTQSLWLSNRSRYRNDCIGQIDRDSPDRQTWTPTHIHLSDYIAASSITHCFDGWSYLGRAVDAELEGDPDTARHLGYYAELRAAMALRAGDGIGVFKNKHVVVGATGRCRCLRSEPTHSFTWKALQHWAASSAGVNTLQESVRPGGVPLREWLAHYPASVNFIATSWLKQWGLDLSRLADDREARNIASYRPTAFTSPGPTTVQDTVDSVAMFWEMCEPGATGGFPVLDRHLLRRGVELVFKASHGRSRLQAPRRYENDIKAMLHGVAPAELSEVQWERFLNYQDGQGTPRILTDANATSGPEHPDHSKEVLARAALLLRVATGSAANILSNITSFGGTELEFWWSGDSVRRRLWPEGSPPATFADLWIDVKEAADSVVTWLQATQQPCHYSLWDERGKEAATLATAERVALWGFGL